MQFVIKFNLEMSSNLISLCLCRKVEQRFHMCDRMAIYFFIAASYSPWWVWRRMVAYLKLEAVCRTTQLVDVL